MEEQNIIIANKGAETNKPQIHLSGVDGKTVEEATQIVFHKMPNGELFIEWYMRSELSHIIMHDQTAISKEAKEKLIEFLKNLVTYE